MAQRELTVPLAHPPAHLVRLGRVASCREIPQDDYALHTPDPRRHLLDAFLTPMLRRLDVQALLAGAEQPFDGPPPGELSNHPGAARLEVGREQVAIAHLSRWITHHDDLDWP